MRGLELMLMGLYTAMQNGTNYGPAAPPEINGTLDISKLDVSMADTNLKNRVDAKPMELKITTWQHMPYSGFKKVNGTWIGEGYAFDVLHLIQRRMNFTYTIIPPDSSRIGNNKTGMMGLLYNQKVDLAVGFIPMMTELRELCEFSNVLDDVEITFLMLRPKESATGQGILAPFSDKVWLCILISCIIFGPTMFILILTRAKLPANCRPEAYSLPTCIWFTYGALLKQGTTSEPMTNPTRLLFATWWIFITILTSFYTANLTAFLTLSEFTLPYNTAKDISQKHQKWVSLKYHSLDIALQTEHSSTLDPFLTSKARKEGTFISLKDPLTMIFDWIRKGYIFLGDRTTITKMITDDYQRKTIEGIEETKRCTYVMQPKNIYVFSRAFGFPLNSPYSEQINKHLMNIVESGIVKHLKTKDLPSVNICPLNLKSKERRLRNTDLSMTYKVMAIGFAVAGMLFLGEVIYRYVFVDKCRKRRKCCRDKGKAPVLPIERSQVQSSFVIKQDSFVAFENLYNQQRIKKNIVNGREYWVVAEKGGDHRLVPIRTPSALLFQCIAE